MPNNPTWEETSDTLQAPSWDDTTTEAPAEKRKGLDWGQILSSGMEMGGGIAAPGSLESKAWSEAGIPQTESIAPELFAKLKFDINPEEPWYKAAAKAASNLAVGIPEFISSPAGISGVYSGMVAPGTTKAFFAADMIKNAVQQAPELMDQWDKMTPAQKAASAVDLVGSIALGAGLTKSVVGDVLKRYAPPAVKLARELETLEPEVKPGTPEAIRQLGVRVPEGPFAQPGIPELANAALGERFQMVKPAGAPEEGALMDLRRALEPPRLEIAQPVARAERIQGGGQAPYGKVSFMREAEAPLPERTQSALSETEPKPAEPAPVEAAVPVTEPAKVAEVKSESVTEGEGPTKGIITGRAIEKWADDTLSGGATHLGPDVLAAYLVKGAALIERGIINFAEWSARMIAEHGDRVKPHLRELFTAAQETVNRAPVAETGTLKSAREIVEQRLDQTQAQAAPVSTGVSTAVPAPTATVPTTGTTTPTTPTTPTAQTGARPRAQVTLDDIYRIFEPAPKTPIPLKTKGINLIESIRTGFSSKFRPINQLAEDIAKAYGGAKKDIAGIFEQLKGSSGKGEADIYRFDRDVSSLVKGQEKDFNAYMFLNRSLDRLRQDLMDLQTAMAGGNVPRLNRRSVAQYTIPQLEAKLAVLEQKLGPERLATFQKAASEYQRYMDNALKLQVESGRMSQDVYNAIKSGNQFYAPFKVMKYLEEGMKPEGTGRKIDTVADYTKAMEGIEDPNFRLGDMLGAARQSLLTSRILADKANAMRNIADLANIDTQKLFIRKLKSGEDVPFGMQGVNVFESGKKVRYATRPEVAEALEIYGNTGGGIISGILRGFSVPFKLGATALNVPFQISNLMADVPRQALVSKYGIRGVNDLVSYPLDLVHAIYSSMAGDILRRDNKLFLDFLDSGAAATTVQEHLTPKALQYRDPSTMSKSKRIALNILYSPAEFSTAIEQVSKILGVKRAMRFEGVQSGAELAKQVPEAITEIRRFSGSPDFGRQGKFVEQARLNLLYMFLNARIQGAVADLGRLAGRDGAKRAAVTWFRVGSAVGLPTAYLYALNSSPEFKSDYDKRPQQEKDNYWLIPKDSFITNEQGERIRDYWRIPKRESSKWIANMTESALNFAEKRDAKTFANFSQKMIEDISPVNIQGNTAQERLESVAASLNPVIKAPLELATGRDMYRHRELLGDTLKRASPEQQYTDRTATAFKVLADKVPDIAPDVLRSPIMLENITRNLTAGLLTQFLSKKPVEGRGKIENAALLQRFQAVPYTDNAEFTKQMQALERESADDYLMRHRAAQKLIEDNNGKTLSELIGKSSQDPKVLKQVVDLWMAKENGATSQDRRLIALPAKQRAQYIAKILKPMSPAEKERAILDMAKKRVLTETVFQEMSQLPQ